MTHMVQITLNGRKVIMAAGEPRLWKKGEEVRTYYPIKVDNVATGIKFYEVHEGYDVDFDTTFRCRSFGIGHESANFDWETIQNEEIARGLELLARRIIGMQVGNHGLRRPLLRQLVKVRDLPKQCGIVTMGGQRIVYEGRGRPINHAQDRHVAMSAPAMPFKKGDMVAYMWFRAATQQDELDARFGGVEMDLMISEESESV